MNKLAVVFALLFHPSLLAQEGPAPIWYYDSFGSKVVRAGSTHSWYVDCTDDEMDDFRWCGVNAIGGNMFRVVVTPRYVDLDIGYDYHPGTEVAVRIDENSPIRWPGDDDKRVPSSIVEKVLQQMLRGELYLTRWYEWPSKERNQQEGHCDGFKEALEWAKQAVASYPNEPVWPKIKAPDGFENHLWSPTGKKGMP